MGYNTWNDVGCNGVTAEYIRSVADVIVERGMDKLGYTYLNIDDCWATARDGTTAELMPDPKAFPVGMGPVAAYVHSKGLKFGLYTDRGVWTCGARPGSAGFEEKDARSFADWGVDYLKVDSCNAPNSSRAAITQYAKMRDALRATGRPIFYALCGWAPWYAEVGEALANSWRVARDVNGICEVWNTVSINSVLAAHAGPGAWNDPDALIGSNVGNRVHLLPHQSRMQFSLWAVMASPLILGANPRSMSAFDIETYTNKEVIDVNQDSLGKQGTIIWENCPKRDVAELVAKANRDRYPLPPQCQQVWGRPLADGAWAIVLVNWAIEALQVTVGASELQQMGLMWGAHVRDLWGHQDLGLQLDDFSTDVPGNGGSAMLKLRPRHAYV